MSQKTENKTAPVTPVAKKSDAGKGDAPRPYSISLKIYGINYDRAFLKHKKKFNFKEKKMVISVTGKQVTAKRLADMVVVDNTERKTSSAYQYNYLRVQFPDGEEKQLLLTDATVKKAVDRANKNPEDCPKATWLRDVLDVELLSGERLGDLEEVINQNKLPAAAKKYNHIRVKFDGKEVHMLLTDSDVKVALERAGKNPEDLPKTGWLKDILD